MKLQHIILSLTGLVSLPSILATAAPDADETPMFSHSGVARLMRRLEYMHWTELY